MITERWNLRPLPSDAKEAEDAIRSVLGSINKTAVSGPKFYDPSQIKRARKAMSMTQQEFAGWIGDVSAGTVGGWERGEHCPSFGAQQNMRQAMRDLANLSESSRRRLSGTFNGGRG